jgi:hypothetical protein
MEICAVPVVVCKLRIQPLGCSGECQVARQLMNAGCPLEIPSGPRGQPRLEVKVEFGTLNEIIELGPSQTGYGLEMVIAD